MSHQPDPELPEEIVNLGHQLLSYSRVHVIRRQDFRDLIEPFTTQYPAPEPAPAYQPNWLSDKPALKADIDRFVAAAQPFLTPPIIPTPSEPARSPARSPTRDTSVEYEIDRNPDNMALSQQMLDTMQNMINNAVNNAVRTAFADRANQGTPGPQGPQGTQGPPGPQGEQGPSGSASSKFSAKEIGYFSPRLDEAEGKGDIVQIGSDTYIRNVYHFIERIKDAVQLRGEEEVKANITQCLRGAAMEWYTDTLTALEKEGLRLGSITLWYDRLEKKWKEPTTLAVKNVLSARYTLEDAVAGKDIAAHIHYVRRHAKPANIGEELSQLSIIYGSIDPILRGLIPAPTPETTPDGFIRACEAQQEIWYETAKYHLRNQRQPLSQSSKQAPKSSGYRYNSSGNRYNTTQPSYRQDTYNPAQCSQIF
jgi:hypothetical protein